MDENEAMKVTVTVLGSIIHRIGTIVLGDPGANGGYRVEAVLDAVTDAAEKAKASSQA